MSNNTDDENSLSDIFCLAHQWLLEDLVTICTKLMSERVNASNVFQLLDFAKQYDNDNLSNCAKRFNPRKRDPPFTAQYFQDSATPMTLTENATHAYSGRPLQGGHQS